jgi:hypothetical protein
MLASFAVSDERGAYNRTAPLNSEVSRHSVVSQLGLSTVGGQLSPTQLNSNCFS